MVAATGEVCPARLARLIVGCDRLVSVIRW